MDVRGGLLLLHTDHCIDDEEFIMKYEVGTTKRIQIDHKINDMHDFISKIIMTMMPRKFSVQAKRLQ